MSKRLHDVTIPILYKSIKVSASETDLWQPKCKPFLGSNKRHLEFVRYLQFEAKFHLNIKKRCPHHALLPDYLGEGDEEDEEDEENDEDENQVEDENQDKEDEVPKVYEVEDTLYLIMCLSENKLRSFRYDRARILVASNVDHPLVGMWEHAFRTAYLKCSVIL